MNDAFFNNGTQHTNHDIFRSSHNEVQTSNRQITREVMEIFEHPSWCIIDENKSDDNDSSRKTSLDHENEQDVNYLSETQNNYNTIEYNPVQEQINSSNCCLIV